MSLHPDYAKYRCWVFDCDGVLLNSNAVKTQAFHDVASQFGMEVADRLIAFHVEHGGISRFVKFQHLFKEILGRDPQEGDLARVLGQFADAVKARLLECEEAPNLRQVLETVGENADTFVVSGGMQDELRDVFAQRGLDQYFTAIFGSPDTKDDILKRERGSGVMIDPAIFVGDARYDAEVANRFGLDFAFVEDWSDFVGWRDYFADKDIKIVKSVADFITV